MRTGCLLPGCEQMSAAALFEKNKVTLLSLAQRDDGLKLLMGEVLVHQNVMKTNFKTEGNDE